MLVSPHLLEGIMATLSESLDPTLMLAISNRWVVYVLRTLSPSIAISHILFGRGIYSTHYLAHVLIRCTFLTTYSHIKLGSCQLDYMEQLKYTYNVLLAP